MVIDGQSKLQSKGVRKRLMISAIVSQGFGFGIDIKEEEMNRINEYRKGKRYVDKKSATHLFGSANKNNLTSSPFLQYLEYGAAKNGYWKYTNIVMKLEGCIDVLTILYPHFEYEFELDHSSDHSKERLDGLSTMDMNSDNTKNMSNPIVMKIQITP